jgi:hypothetical protein
MNARLSKGTIVHALQDGQWSYGRLTRCGTWEKIDRLTETNDPVTCVDCVAREEER